MTHFLHHYLWTDLWGPIWPNIAASPVIGGFVAVSRFVGEVRAERRHHAAEKAADARHTELLQHVRGDAP